jgi:hypothetical protein
MSDVQAKQLGALSFYSIAAALAGNGKNAPSVTAGFLLFAIRDEMYEIAKRNDIIRWGGQYILIYTNGYSWIPIYAGTPSLHAILRASAKN